jgi:hypothetical protein
LKDTLQNRLILCGFGIGLLFLSFAVFAWGLGYKLALYKHVDGSTNFPEAKLLITTEQVRHVAVTVLQAAKQADCQQVLFLLDVLVLGVVLHAAFSLSTFPGRFQLSDAWKARRLVFLNPLFFRPPPVLA